MRLHLEWRARSERQFGEREYSVLPYLADKVRPSVDISAAVKGVQAAVSNPEGAVILRVPVVRIGGADPSLPLPGRGTIDERKQFPGLSSVAAAEHRVVAMMPAQAIPADVGLIKIDVEGHEGEILASLPDAVWQARPTLLVEVGASDRGSSLREVHERLTSGGCLALAMGARGLRYVSRSLSPDLSVNIIGFPAQ